MMIDDILVSGALAGLVGGAIRLTFSWATYALGMQRMTLSHVYSLWILRTIGPGGMVVGTLVFVFNWALLGVVLSQVLAWYGFRYWWIKGLGLVAVSWPLMYLAAIGSYSGPPAMPGASNALTSLVLSLIGGLAAAGILARWARWPGRSELLGGPAPARQAGLASQAGPEPMTPADPPGTGQRPDAPRS